jgi:hypothetical protein
MKTRPSAISKNIDKKNIENNIIESRAASVKPNLKVSIVRPASSQ